MLQITIKADYAIRVAIYLAQQESGKCVSAMEIARDQEIPKALIPKILQALSHKGILSTTSGRNGGATLIKNPEDITIHELIVAIDGPITLNRCLREEGACSRTGFCPVHPFWATTRNKFVDILKDSSVADIIRSYVSKFI